MPLEFVSVPTADVRTWARYVADYVEQLAERDHTTPDDMIDKAASGAAQWHLVLKDKRAVKALIATGIDTYPNGRRECRVGVAGADRQDWDVWALAQTERFAAKAGCTSMKLIARPGWERVFRDAGYARTHVVLEKELTP
jgi:hypothetical protein